MNATVVIAGFLLIVGALLAAVVLLAIAAYDRTRERDDAIRAIDEVTREAGALRAQLYVAGDQLADCRAQLTLMSLAAILPTSPEKDQY